MTRIELFPLRRGTATGKRTCRRAQGDVPAAYRVEVSKHPGIRTNIPHLHAIYAEFEASFFIDSGEILAGSLPGKQARRVSRWIKKRRDELQANWERVTNNEELQWIDP